MVEERELSPAQQTIVRTLSAERARAILTHDAALAEYIDLLKASMKLKGDWSFGGTMDAIKLVHQEEPPKESSE